MTNFFRDSVWGWDVGRLGLRIYWHENNGWPQVVKDAWCWHFIAGPFYLSGHRHVFWP